ncbi:hypothetical protein [Thiohalobacter thiocyanaticus]|uniref:Uncharacterized protein n=1 Tax=Thiohalobacter thiocyanaticus TaxID=585455 RepID=A0A426QMA4_9GAMM|nr:hypothetical protein [Thiohalobacter thiocyanaticus]RRQ22888.1 hypothetical protein D6C00_13760 [Thiohalobacter thiocyanaticus]
MLLRRFLTSLLLILVSAVHAHDNSYFDNNPSPHGGQVRMAGPFHLELTLDQDALTVYVMNHANKPETSQGLDASAVILDSQGKTRLQLVPGEGNVLEGDLGDGFRLTQETLVMLMVKTPDGKQHQARFTPGSYTPCCDED